MREARAIEVEDSVPLRGELRPRRRRSDLLDHLPTGGTPGVTQGFYEPDGQVGRGLPGVEGADEIAVEYVPAVGLVNDLDLGDVGFVAFAEGWPGIIL
jgi:hypothetical protein